MPSAQKYIFQIMAHTLHTNMIVERLSNCLRNRVVNVKTATKHSLNPLTSRPGCMPGSRYTGVGVLFFVI